MTMVYAPGTTFREFVNRIKADTMRECRELPPDGDPPHRFYIWNDGYLHFHDLPWEAFRYAEDKNRVVEMARQIIGVASRPEFVGWRQAMWAAPETEFEDPPQHWSEPFHGDLSKHPDRRETIVVQVIDPERAEQWVSLVKRRPRKPQRLEEWQGPILDFESRFIDPLREIMR